MELILGGVLIGVALSMFIFKITYQSPKPSGTFVIDVSDPMKDICRLELDENINSIFEKKQIVLNVESHGDISQN